MVYAESQGGGLVRHNRKDGQTKNIKPIPGQNEPAYRFNWNSPIALSPTDPERMYFGAQFVFRTMDRGNTWTRISPDLTTNDPTRQKQKESGGFSLDNSGAENNTTKGISEDKQSKYGKPQLENRNNRITSRPQPVTYYGVDCRTESHPGDLPAITPTTLAPRFPTV